MTAFVVPALLEEAFFSVWEPEVAVYGKPSMGGWGISLWGICGQLAYSSPLLCVIVSI